MTKALRSLFTKIGSESYGPRTENPVYAIASKDGVRYVVKRHRWQIPNASWGWKAYVQGSSMSYNNGIYGNTLDEIANALGHEEVA